MTDLPPDNIEGGALTDLGNLNEFDRQRLQSGLTPEEQTSLASTLGGNTIGTQPANIGPQEITAESIDTSGLSTEITGPEAFGGADIKTPESLQTAETLPAFAEDGPGPPEARLPVVLTEAEIRGVGLSTRGSIIEASQAASLEDTQDPKQARRLSERQELQDHFNTNVVDNKDGSFTATGQAVGVKSRGKDVGKDKPRSITFSRGQVARFGLEATSLAENYSRMSSNQQNIGVAQLFTNFIRPYVRVQTNSKGEVIKEGVPSMAAVGTIVDGLSLNNQWGRIDDVNKFRKVSNTMVRGVSDLGFKETIPAEVTNNLAYLNFGYSAYNMVNNWNNMSVGQRTIATVNTINQGVQAYTVIGQSAFLNGLTGSVAAGSTAVATQSAAAVSQGVSGAAVAGGQISGTISASTTALGAEAGVTTATANTASAGASGAAVQGANTSVSAGTGGTTTAGAVASYAGMALAAYYAYEMIDNWGQGGDANSRSAQASRGAAIGTTIYPGIGTAIGAAVGLAIGSINAGKSGPQRKRDSLRSGFTEMGMFEKDDDGRVRVELDDGSFYDVGVDGSGSRALNADGSKKKFARPDQIADRDKAGVAGNNELRPYDIDYTNDLDYIASIATKGANLLPVGGTFARRTSEVDQIGGYLTNAATSNVEREWTKDNFGAVMGNVRKFYGNMGITSFDQGKKIADAMRKDKKLSSDDYNAMVLGFEFAFRSDFDRATQLLDELGRFSEEPPANIPEGEFKELQDQDRADVEAAQRGE